MKLWLEHFQSNPRTTIMGFLGLAGVISHISGHPEILHDQVELTEQIMTAIGCVGAVLGKDWIDTRRIQGPR